MSDFIYQEGLPLDWSDMNFNLRQMQAKYLDSANSAAIAIAAANFKGNWSALTGALAVPSAVYHSSKFWLLLSNLADVTASEPGVDADWLEIITGNVIGPASATNNELFVADGVTGKVMKGGTGLTAVAGAIAGLTGLSGTFPITGVTSINGGQLAGLRNKIINGNFDVWQAGTSTAGATGSGTGYAADMWQGTRAAFAAGMTVSRQLAGLTGHQYCARIQRDSGNSGTGVMIFGSVLETLNSIGAQGQTLTLSFRARAGANFSAASSAMACSVYTGTGTDQNCVTGAFTGQVTNNATKTLTTSWQTFSTTVTVGASVTQLAAMFFFTPTGTAGAADYMEIAGVQLEPGTVATPFEQRPIGLELALCQRYYYREETGGVSAAPYAGHVQMLSTTQGRMIVRFPVPMRVRPTALEQSGTAANWQLVHGAASTALSSVPTFQNATTTAAAVDVFVASGLTVGQVGYLRATSTTNTYLAWSARL